MQHYGVVFLVTALVAAMFGFGGIAAGAAGIDKVLFLVFMVLAAFSFAFGLFRHGQSAASPHPVPIHPHPRGCMSDTANPPTTTASDKLVDQAAAAARQGIHTTQQALDSLSSSVQSLRAKAQQASAGTTQYNQLAPLRAPRSRTWAMPARGWSPLGRNCAWRCAAR